MDNVGIVLYRNGDKPGTLTAKWSHTNDGEGTGIATGGPAEGYEGRYKIRYFDKNDNFQAERDLEIRKEGGNYVLSWYNDGKKTCMGLGMEVSEGLAAGYHDIKDI